MLRTTMTFAAATLVLTACGGGGGSTASSPPSGEELYAFAISEPNSIQQTIVMPASGTARYDGVFALSPMEPDPDFAIVGDAAFDANFAQGTIDGSVSRFFGLEIAPGFVVTSESPVEGSLAVDGIFVGSDALVQYIGIVGDTVVNGELSGAFYGTEAAEFIATGEFADFNVLLKTER